MLTFHLKALKAKGKAELEIPIESLKKSRDLAEEEAKSSVLQAKTDGKILKILAHPGDVVGGGEPILRMADTRHMKVVAEVYETEILRIREGQKATITSPAFEGKLSPGELEDLKRRGETYHLDGTVQSIGNLIAKNRNIAIDPTQDADRRVLEVNIGLEDKDCALAAQLINLQVTVTILMDGP